MIPKLMIFAEYYPDLKLSFAFNLNYFHECPSLARRFSWVPIPLLFALNVVSLFDIPEEIQVSRERGLPSTLFPSDHIRIEALF